jgi:DNA mismatch repair ATPase MutS
MNNPIAYYEKHLKSYQKKEVELKKQLAVLSTLRLMVFIMTGVLIYFSSETWQLALIEALIGTVIFIVFLSKHSKAKSERAFYKALIEINEDEIKINEGDFHDRDEGLEYQTGNHSYSVDIDLFGRGSFFQYLNRTTIKEGSKNLAESLKANDINDIQLRQECIKELCHKPQWRQFYSAHASLVSTETSAENIVKWLLNHHSFLPKVMRWVPIGFSVISIILLALTIFNVIDKSLIGYWLLVGLAVTSVYLKRINNLSSNSDKVKDTFRQYATLLNQIEGELFNSEILKQKQNLITFKGKKASIIFKEFSKALDALDNRNNLISAIFGNGLFLLDLKNSYKVEQWISKYAHTVEDWLEVIAFFDAYNSLGNLAFNHPEFVWPEIKNNGVVIKAKQLGHPLLNKSKRIDSDVTINNQQFFIVTGANMAGKSTFLRTISLHIVMANVGLPVCAKTSEYSPVKLISSMRTSDSLVDETSYFFSELKRLKYIVETIKDASYFIVLDEILKGTNSTDKAIGSKKFVEKLVASGATGIIATHDLSLCEIENELKAIKNYYFDAEIINDELHFDYTLKKGVCKNMNASFLLKKMDIV